MDLLPACDLSSQSLSNVFYKAEVVNFNDVQLTTFFFHGSCFQSFYLESLCFRESC